MAKTRPDKNGVAKIQPEQIGKNDNVEPKKEAFSFDEQYVSEFMVDMLSEKNDYKEMGKISKGDPITIRDLQTLQADMYVNDTIINTYIQLVVNETNTPENPTKVHAFNSFAFSKCGTENPILARWVRKINLLDYNWLIFPINDENHWSIVVVDFKRSCFIYYDSVEFESRQQEEYYNEKYLNRVSNFIDYYAKEKGSGDGFTRNFYRISQNTPVQGNKVDCGVFVCLFVKHFCRQNLDYTFSTDINGRVEIFMEIAAGSLI